MNGRILIADGQVTNRIALKVRLAAACYDVVGAADLAQLLQSARDTLPQMIVVGSGLPGLDTGAICARLRQEPACADLPILALCPEAGRLAAMRAGASAVLDPAGDEMLLLARVRGLMRDRAPAGLVHGLAEAPASFAPAPLSAAQGAAGRGAVADADRMPRVALVADSPARALAWKHALSRHLPYRFAIFDAEQALAGAGQGEAADLYLIAADLDRPGAGLRLMSELRARPPSRDAACIVALPEARADLAPMALDLGAGDTLPLGLAAPDRIELAAIALREQVTRKRQADGQRAAARQSLIWAITDPLTGLYNRRHALPRLAEAAREALMTDGDCAVLALDIDHFKRINDQHGHAAGDAVLTEIAARLAALVAGAGLVARMGGEEFVAVLPGFGPNVAARMAEALRVAITARPVRLPSLSGGRAVTVTASIGIATCRAQRASDPAAATDLMLHAADRAMRSAKASGRNRVALSGQDEAA